MVAVTVELEYSIKSTFIFHFYSSCSISKYVRTIYIYGSNCQPFLSFVHSAVTGRHRHNMLLQTELLQQEGQHLSYTCILEDAK